MDLRILLQQKQIDEFGYDTIFLERPMSDIIDFDYRQILAAPDKNSSPNVLRELKLVSSESISRTKSDLDLVYQIDKNIDELFIDLLDDYRLKYPISFINLFYDIVYPLLLNTKGYWNRPRPIQLGQIYNIKIDFLETYSTNSASYPSGHVVYSSLVAMILKNIYPEIDTKKIDQIVTLTAKARVLQGAHFPSDNKASLIFTEFVFNRLYPKLRKYYHDQI